MKGCKDLDENNCNSFNSDNDEEKCVNDGNGGCELKKCEQLDVNNCNNYGSFNQKICMENENYDGGKLFSYLKWTLKSAEDFIFKIANILDILVWKFPRLFN